MKMLRKTLKAIVVIVLLKVITFILDRYSPNSMVFHRQFLFSMQMLLVGWLLITLILFIFKAGKSWVARFLPILIVMLVLGLDILFSFWMENPVRVPSFLKREYKQYYASFERNIMEYEPCSIFDSTYSFKIIPGLAYNFGNIEYRNNYVVNSESVRDDQESLIGPEIICVGSAYTFGIGVDQDKIFPALLQKQTGQAVLNTGNPSYGTFRQMKRMVNADTSLLKHVVVQYSKYDVYENAAFLANKNPFTITSDAEFRKTLTEYRWSREYFPGKYCVTICYNWIKNFVNNNFRKNKYYLSNDPVASADYFLKIIDTLKPPAHTKIIVTEINDFKDMNSGFLHALDSLLIQPKFASLRTQLQTTNVSDVLTPDDYYIIDANLRTSGQEKVAKRIAEIIAKDSATQNGNK